MGCVGSEWDDITTILVILFEYGTQSLSQKNQEYGFIIRFHYGGYLEQKYTLSQKRSRINDTGIAYIRFGNKFLNMTLGSILKTG